MQFEIDGFARIVNECNVIDTYRHIHKDKKEFSWLSPLTRNKTHGWRLDYFLVSEQLINEVQDSCVHENWQKNDHMPIELEINIE